VAKDDDTSTEASRRDLASPASGRWVALDDHDQVQRDAETLEDLMAMLDSKGVEGLSITRTPAPGEPVVYGPAEPWLTATRIS